MPFINESSEAELLEGATFYDHATMAKTSFDEAFDASLGQVIDEELSISSMLNREGYTERNLMIDEKIKAGEIQNVDKYRTKGGRARNLDYGKIAADLEDPNIKTDSVLRQERADLLKQKRDYAQDVIDRGSGTAQFLGAMNAYMIDPINIATVGIAAPATTARATGIVSKAILTGRNAALIEGSAELGIQALVYQHKNDIESPYSAGDALANVAMAATGAFALGSVQGGISEWLGKLIGKAEELPATEEVTTAIDYLKRQHDTLKGSPKAENPADQVQTDIDFLNEMSHRAEQYDHPAKSADIYELPTGQVEEVKKPPASASQREREILSRQGMAEHFDDDMASFNEIENPVLQIDDDLVDPREIIKQFDDEIQGLDDVLRCAYG